MGDLIKRENAKYCSFKDKDHALIFFFSLEEVSSVED